MLRNKVFKKSLGELVSSQGNLEAAHRKDYRCAALKLDVQAFLWRFNDKRTVTLGLGVFEGGRT